MEERILSAHPVAPDIRQRVMASLEAIEATHDVKVLFACESGSRGWGFASPDSDYDVRFVYVHRLSWYLAVEDGRDGIELPISDELDISGWELRKALRLLRRSNPTLLEWLDSPIVYRKDVAAADRMRALADAFFSPVRGRHHYLAMARKNFQDCLQGDSVRIKKYLYVLRSLLAVQWIDRGLGMPPMRFAALVFGLVQDEVLLAEINRLLAIKMKTGEAEHGPRWPRIHVLIQDALAQAEAVVDYKKPVGEAGELDQFLMETVQAHTG